MSMGYPHLKEEFTPFFLDIQFYGVLSKALGSAELINAPGVCKSLIVVKMSFLGVY